MKDGERWWSMKDGGRETRMENKTRWRQIVARGNRKTGDNGD